MSMNNIEISPKAIGGQSFLYGVLVKTAEDWIKDELPHREYVVGAKFLAALLIMISTNLESSGDGAEEAVASFAIDLYLNRKVVMATHSYSLSGNLMFRTLIATLVMLGCSRCFHRWALSSALILSRIASSSILIVL